VLLRQYNQPLRKCPLLLGFALESCVDSDSGQQEGSGGRARLCVVRTYIQRTGGNQSGLGCSERSKPSMRSSPWIRGAPQVGFSATIWKINSRISSASVSFQPASGLWKLASSTYENLLGASGQQFQDEKIVSILTRPAEQLPRRACREARDSGEDVDASA
jgi:hypothetical protein